MEFNKIAGAILVTLLVMMVIAKIGNSLVPPFHPPADKPGATAPGPSDPRTAEPEKPVAELIAAATPEDGQNRAKACVACHSFEKGGAAKQGPNLWDVIGRKKGSVQGFDYSPAMRQAQGNWTYEDLFKYLGNPQAVVPNNKMAFQLPRAAHRAAVIAYLRTLSDSPKPLPAAEKKSDAPQPGAPPAAPQPKQ